MQKKPDYMDETFNSKPANQSWGADYDDTMSCNASESAAANAMYAHSNCNTVSRLMEYSRRHIQKVVTEQLFVNDLSCEKWE